MIMADLIRPGIGQIVGSRATSGPNFYNKSSTLYLVDNIRGKIREVSNGCGGGLVRYEVATQASLVRFQSIPGGTRNKVSMLSLVQIVEQKEKNR